VSRLESILKAAELARRGLSTSEIADELGVSRSTVQRAKAARPDLFGEVVLGSHEHKRAVLLDALGATLADGRPDHATRVRAAEDLSKLDPNAGSKGPGLVRVILNGPTYCPACGERLEAESSVVERGSES
jgi:AcrR family transcriptional regulator